MNTYKRISVKEAKDILKNKKSMLLDIRADEDYDESHDPQAFHLVGADLTSFIETIHKKTPLLIICYHGNSSQQAAQYLVNQGFDEVYSVDGGYEEWKVYANA